MSIRRSEKDKEIFITRVIIENFPSRVELYQKLENFVTENNYPKDYFTDNKDNIVCFIFKNADVAFDFVKQLNIEKIKNPLYAKIKTNIVVDAKKELIKKHSQSPPKKEKKKDKVNEILLTNPNEKEKESNGKNGYKHKTNLSSPIRTLNNINISNKILKTEGKAKDQNSNFNSNSNHNILLENDYSSLLPRGKTLVSTSPYTTEAERQYKEYLQNKQKWIIKKGFEVNFGKLEIEKKYAIPNYVFISPPKIPLNKYQFRDVNKEKWVNKKEFMYKNSKDLVW